VLAMDFRHCQILDPVGDAVAFPKSIEFWKDRRIIIDRRTAKFYCCFLFHHVLSAFTVRSTLVTLKGRDEPLPLRRLLQQQQQQPADRCSSSSQAAQGRRQAPGRMAAARHHACSAMRAWQPSCMQQQGRAQPRVQQAYRSRGPRN
jgi:hypothetical protein